MEEKIIIDADLCIKLGGSRKYRFLYDIIPLISKEIYMHTYTYNEVLMPISAVEQLRDLVLQRKIMLVNESNLVDKEKEIYNMAYRMLERVMINPSKPNKNRGEICSLAYAKAKHIPFFVTDEKDLQPIIDRYLNVGIEDIMCLRIEDIVYRAKKGEIPINRKVAKSLWIIAGKRKELFDEEIWKINI